MNPLLASYLLKFKAECLFSINSFRISSACLTTALIILMGLTDMARADIVWHCSRPPPAAAANVNHSRHSHKTQTSQENELPTFGISKHRAKLSTFNLSATNVIELELMDIYTIYSGENVPMGSRKLSACFISGARKSHIEAMDLLGINIHAADNSILNTSIDRRNLYPVKNEDEMQTCIEDRHPAIGYLRQATDTDRMSPCF